jgi:hypothetical protein
VSGNRTIQSRDESMVVKIVSKWRSGRGRVSSGPEVQKREDQSVAAHRRDCMDHINISTKHSNQIVSGFQDNALAPKIAG